MIQEHILTAIGFAAPILLVMAGLGHALWVRSHETKLQKARQEAFQRDAAR